MNIIYGDNAQGKTNIIEAIWLFSGCKSFRGAKDREMIAFLNDFADLTITFEDKERVQTARIKMEDKKKCVLLNKVPLKSASELSGNFLCVVFSPTHLSLVKDGPVLRRKFLDTAIAQIKPQYLTYLLQYEKVLSQKNALIKDVKKFSQLKETLDSWDIQLAKLGTIITIFRKDYVSKLDKTAQSIYSGFSNDKEKIELSYQSTVFSDLSEIDNYSDKNIEQYLTALKQNYEQDIKYGFTTVGIHRDDLGICLNQKDCKTYGSQGQQRSTVLALKLSEAKILKSVTGENPIILLDDVMSELDTNRQDYILNHVKDSQVFVTCCDIANTLRLTDGKIFHIQDGVLTNEK
jgi:DNA replication and repair protein RecF